MLSEVPFENGSIKLELKKSKFQLLFENEFSRVEKIKVISSTYMAACGLQPGRKGSNETSSLGKEISCSLLLTYKKGFLCLMCFINISAPNAGNGSELFSAGENCKVMAKFGAAMMQELKNLTFEKFELQSKPEFRLRIGLNVGPVIAGVVGAQKPLYDIWSNTVNVASRMDYTGIEGKIQVPEEAAKHLMAKNVSCTFRDTIFVKGKGEMKVHFVDLDKDLLLMSIDKVKGAEELEEDRKLGEIRALNTILANKKESLEETEEVAATANSSESDDTDSDGSRLPKPGNLLKAQWRKVSRRSHKSRSSSMSAVSTPDLGSDRSANNNNNEHLAASIDQEVRGAKARDTSSSSSSSSEDEGDNGRGVLPPQTLTLDPFDLHREAEIQKQQADSSAASALLASKSPEIVIEDFEKQSSKDSGEESGMEELLEEERQQVRISYCIPVTISKVSIFWFFFLESCPQAVEFGGSETESG